MACFTVEIQLISVRNEALASLANNMVQYDFLLDNGFQGLVLLSCSLGSFYLAKRIRNLSSSQSASSLLPTKEKMAGVDFYVFLIKQQLTVTVLNDRNQIQKKIQMAIHVYEYKPFTLSNPNLTEINNSLHLYFSGSWIKSIVIFCSDDDNRNGASFLSFDSYILILESTKCGTIQLKQIYTKAKQSFYSIWLVHCLALKKNERQSVKDPNDIFKLNYRIGITAIETMTLASLQTGSKLENSSKVIPLREWHIDLSS